MLYTLSRSPYNCDLKALIRTTNPKDDYLLLLSDGVIAGINGSVAARVLNLSNLTIYALENDIIARGLSPYFLPSITRVNYNEFVILTEKQQKQMAW